MSGWTRALRTVAPGRAVREFLEECEAEGGWEARLTRRGHVQLRRADGRGRVLTMPGTPSDHRAIRNARAACKRISNQDLRV